MAEFIKILNYIDDEVYVGATIQPLSKRMALHRADARRPKEAALSIIQKMMEHGIENFYIELIEAYPCENNEELRKREGHYIREFGTLNKRIAGRTPQEYAREYHRDNLEKVLARKREYREANRDIISERAKATYTCPCGSTCRSADRAKHERTKKHRNVITTLDVLPQTES